MQEMDQSTKQVIAQSSHLLPGFFTPERLVAIRDAFDHMVSEQDIRTGSYFCLFITSPLQKKT